MIDYFHVLRRFNWRRYTHLQLDTRGVWLAVLFALVIWAAAELAPFFVSSGVESVATDSSTAQQAAGGVGVSLWVVFEASVLLGLIALFRRAPDWLQPVVQETIRVGFWGGVAIVAAMLFGPLAGLTVATVAFFLVQAADALDVYWLLNDAFAIGLAVYFGAAAAVLAGPIVLGVALVGLSLYDHVFANQRDWMYTLARGAVRWKVPALFVVPKRWRLEWSELASFSTDEEQSHIGSAIGMADLGLPTAFVTALAIGGPTLPAMGAVAGIIVACFRLSWVMSNTGAAAGLPSLSTGALGGWALATLLVVLV